MVTICAAAFLLRPNHKMALAAFLSTIPLHLIIIHYFPDMNYFVRAGWVILIAFMALAIPTMIQNGSRPISDYFKAADNQMTKIGWGLAASLVLLHIVFH